MFATDNSNQSQEFYEGILRKAGIEYTKIEVKAPPFQGENFGSTVNFITVEQGAEKGTLELFSKKNIRNSGYAEQLEKLQLFKKESSFFNTIVPLFQDLIRARIGDADYKLDMIPKCYFASEEAIVMENLAKRDYILLDKLERQTLDQAKMVIKALAKYHAPSYVILSEKIKPDEVFEQYPFLEERMFVENPEADFLSQFMEPSLNMQILILSVQ